VRVCDEMQTEFLCHTVYSYIYDTVCPSSRQIVAFLLTMVYLPGPNICVSDLCFSFNSSGPISSGPDIVVTFNGFTVVFPFQPLLGSVPMQLVL